MLTRANKPERTAGDLATDPARLLLEVQRLRLENTGLRHDNATVRRDRDRLLTENIALRQGEQNRTREAALRSREADLERREAARVSEIAALRQQLEKAERDLHQAQLQKSLLELELAVRNAFPGAKPAGQVVPRSEVAHELRELIRICHPDKWQDAAVATELTKHLNALRTQYAE